MAAMLEDKILRDESANHLADLSFLRPHVPVAKLVSRSASGVVFLHGKPQDLRTLSQREYIKPLYHQLVGFASQLAAESGIPGNTALFDRATVEAGILVDSQEYTHRKKRRNFAYQHADGSILIAQKFIVISAGNLSSAFVIAAETSTEAVDFGFKNDTHLSQFCGLYTRITKASKLRFRRTSEVKKHVLLLEDHKGRTIATAVDKTICPD